MQPVGNKSESFGEQTRKDFERKGLDFDFVHCRRRQLPPIAQCFVRVPK